MLMANFNKYPYLTLTKAIIKVGIYLTADGRPYDMMYILKRRCQDVGARIQTAQKQNGHSKMH